MAYSETKITARIETPEGQPAAGARVEARLDTADIELDAGFVVPNPVSAIANGSGEVEFFLWPNTRGQAGTQYQVVIRAEDGRTLASGNIVVPQITGESIPLSDLWETAPNEPVALTNALVESAQGYRNEARNYAGNASRSATTAEEAATAAGIARDQANSGVDQLEDAIQSAGESATASARSAESSAASARRAQSSEDSVAGSVTQVNSGVAEARDAVTAAKGHADSASGSAREADISAENAAQSATSAKSDADGARDYFNQVSEAQRDTQAIADQAASSATAAADSATDAAKSAAVASDSATQVEQAAQDLEPIAASASNSAKRAETAADNSATSAAESAASAQAAKGSASAASGSETAAGSSATAAAGSASEAKAGADDAKTSATNAGQAAETATSAASDASTSATSAAESATAATEAFNNSGENAQRASEAATLASDSASEAAGSATAASKAALDSQNDAQTAEAAKNNAVEEASRAGRSASSASGSATAASTSASSAAESASTAQTAATTATSAADRSTTAAENAESEVVDALNEVGIGDVPVRLTSEYPLADLLGQNVQFWYVDDAGETPWPGQRVLVSSAGTADSLAVQEVLFDGNSLATRTYQNSAFQPWDVLLEGGMVPESRIPAYPASRLEGALDVTQIPGLSESDTGAEAAGTAQSLMDEHRNASDPHPQYVTAEELADQVPSSGGGVNLLANATFAKVDADNLPQRWETTAAGIDRTWVDNRYLLTLSPGDEELRLTTVVPDGQFLGGQPLQFSAEVGVSDTTNPTVALISSANVGAVYAMGTTPRSVTLEATPQVDDPETYELLANIRLHKQSEAVQNADMPAARYAQQSASDSRYVYVYGGRAQDGFDWFNASSASDTFYRLDTYTGVWDQLPNEGGPGRLSGGGMVHYQGNLYVFGGTANRSNQNQDADLANLWRYSLADQTWTDLGETPFRKFWIGFDVGASGGPLAGKIVVAGGYNIGGNVDGVHVYDIAEDTWYSVGSMPYNANNPGVAVVGDRIYLGGGYRNSPRTWFSSFYHSTLIPTTEGDGFQLAWEQLPDMPNGRTTFGITQDTAGGRIFVSGGNGSDGVMSDVAVYDIANAEWTALADTQLPPMRFHTVAYVGDHTITLGGYTGSTTLADSWNVRTYIGLPDGYTSALPPADSRMVSAPPAASLLVARPEMQYAWLAAQHGPNATVYRMTGAEYDALETKDPNAIYIIDRS